MCVFNSLLKEDLLKIWEALLLRRIYVIRVRKLKTEAKITHATVPSGRLFTFYSRLGRYFQTLKPEPLKQWSEHRKC